MKKIMYISTTIPALTMTFVYREIQVLLKAGYDIVTVSRGTPRKEMVSNEAILFYETTLYLDQVGLFRKILSQLYVLFSRRREWFKILGLILKEKELKGHRDQLRLLYHFLEAGYLYTQFKDKGLSHIHAHILNAPTSIALFLSRYLNIPYSFTMHASNIWIDPLMLKTKLLLCKKAITISKYNKKYLLNKYGEQFENKIDVIHCGIDIETFKAQGGKKSMPPIILSVGQLVERKGFLYLLDACHILKDKGLDFRWYIAGDGEQMDLLTNRSSSLGINDVVTFLGAQPQEAIHKLLQDASIFILASIITDEGGREGIPVSLMEAMAMELPVVSTKTVGIAELIGDKREGLLVEQKDAVELALAIEFLLKNADARDRMGKQGRIKVTREFNIAHFPAHIHDIFN